MRVFLLEPEVVSCSQHTIPLRERLTQVSPGVADDDKRDHSMAIIILALRRVDPIKTGTKVYLLC